MGAGASASEPSSEKEALAAGYSPEAISEYRHAKLESMGFEAGAIARALREQPNDEAALSWLLENPGATKAETKADGYDGSGYYNDYKSLYQIPGTLGRSASTQGAAAATAVNPIAQTTEESLAHSETSPSETSLPRQFESMVHESATALQAELVAMGFSPNAAVHALNVTSCDLNSALNWLMAQAETVGSSVTRTSSSSSSVAVSDSGRHTAPRDRSSNERQQKAISVFAESSARNGQSAINVDEEDMALATVLSASEAESKVDHDTQARTETNSEPTCNPVPNHSLDIQDCILSYLRRNTGGKPIEDSMLRKQVFAQPGLNPSAQWADFDAALEALVLDRAVIFFNGSASNVDDAFSGSNRGSSSSVGSRNGESNITDWVQLASAASNANPMSDNSTSADELVNTQAGIAESILAAHEEGRLTSSDEAMLPWAKGMRQLKQVLAAQKETQESDTGDGLGSALAESLNPQIKAIKAQLSVERLKVDLAVCHALEAENDDLRLRLEREVAVPLSGNNHSGSNEIEASNMNTVFSNSSNSSGGRSKLLHEETPGKVDVSAMLAILFRRAEELKEEMHAARKPALAFLQRPHCIGHKPYEEVYLFLKDLVHSRADLAAQRFAIHRYIVDRVGEDVGQDILPLMLALLAKEDEAVIVAREIRRLLALQGHGSFCGGEGKDGESSLSHSQLNPKNSRFSAGDYAADDFDLSILSALEDETKGAESATTLRRAQHQVVSNSLVPFSSSLVVSNRDEGSSLSGGGTSLRDALAVLQAATEARERALSEAAAYASAKLELKPLERSALRRGFLAGEAKMHRLRVLHLREQYEAGSCLSSSFREAIDSSFAHADSEEVASLQVALREEYARQKGALNDVLRNERDERRARLMNALKLKHSTSLSSSDPPASSGDIVSAQSAALGELTRLDASCDAYTATALALPTLRLYATLAAVGSSHNGSSRGDGSSSLIENGNDRGKLAAPATDTGLTAGDGTDATNLQQPARDLAVKVVNLWRAHAVETSALNDMLRNELGRQRDVVCSGASGAATAIGTSRMDSLEPQTAAAVAPESAPLFLSREGSTLLDHLESAFESRCAAPREALELVHVHEFDNILGQNQSALSSTSSSHDGGWKEAVALLREAQSNEVAAISATLDSLGDEARGRLSEKVAVKRRDRTQRLLALTRQGEEDAADNSYKSGDDAGSEYETALERQLALSAHFATVEAEEAVVLEQQLALRADAAMSQLAHFHGACFKSLAQAAEVGLQNGGQSSNKNFLWRKDSNALSNRASAVKELQCEMESIQRKVVPQPINVPGNAKDFSMHYADAKSLLLSHKAAREAKEEKKQQVRTQLTRTSEKSSLAEIDADSKALQIETENVPLLTSSNEVADSKSIRLVLPSSDSAEVLALPETTKGDEQLQLMNYGNDKPIPALKERADAVEAPSLPGLEAEDKPLLLTNSEAKLDNFLIEARRIDLPESKKALTTVTPSPQDDGKMEKSGDKRALLSLDDSVANGHLLFSRKYDPTEAIGATVDSTLKHHGDEEREDFDCKDQQVVAPVNSMKSNTSLTADVPADDDSTPVAGNAKYRRSSSSLLGSNLPPIGGKTLPPLHQQNLNQDADAIRLILGMWLSSDQNSGTHSSRFDSHVHEDDSSQSSSGRRGHQTAKEQHKSNRAKRKQKHRRRDKRRNNTHSGDDSHASENQATVVNSGEDWKKEGEGKHLDDGVDIRGGYTQREEWHKGRSYHRKLNVRASNKLDSESTSRRARGMTLRNGDDEESGSWENEDVTDFSLSRHKLQCEESENKHRGSPSVEVATLGIHHNIQEPPVEDIDTSTTEKSRDWAEEEVEDEFVGAEVGIDEDEDEDEDEDDDGSIASPTPNSRLPASSSMNGVSYGTSAEDASVGREWANAMALQRVEDDLAAMTNQSWRNLNVKGKLKSSNGAPTNKGRAAVTVSKGGFQNSAHEEEDEDWSAWDGDVGVEIGSSIVDEGHEGSDRNTFKDERVETTILAPPARPTLAPLKNQRSGIRVVAAASNGSDVASSRSSSQFKCAEEMDEIDSEESEDRHAGDADSGLGSMAAEVARVAAFHESEANKLNMCFQVQQARQDFDLADGFGGAPGLQLLSGSKSAWRDEGKEDRDSADEVEDPFLSSAGAHHSPVASHSSDLHNQQQLSLRNCREPLNGLPRRRMSNKSLSPSPSFGVNSTSLRFLQNRKWANEVQQPRRGARESGSLNRSGDGSGGGGGAASDSSSQRRGTTRVGSFTIQRD